MARLPLSSKLCGLLEPPEDCLLALPGGLIFGGPCGELVVPEENPDTRQKQFGGALACLPSLQLDPLPLIYNLN